MTCAYMGDRCRSYTGHCVLRVSVLIWLVESSPSRCPPTTTTRPTNYTDTDNDRTATRARHAKKTGGKKKKKKSDYHAHPRRPHPYTIDIWYHRLVHLKVSVTPPFYTPCVSRRRAGRSSAAYATTRSPAYLPGCGLGCFFVSNLNMPFLIQ